MELKDNIEIQLDKGKTKKLKCYTFKVEELEGREFAVHECVETAGHTTVSDVITGCKAFTLKESIENISESTVMENLQNFIKHYTIKEILAKLRKLEEHEQRL